MGYRNNDDEVNEYDEMLKGYIIPGNEGNNRRKAIAELRASQVSAPEAYTPGVFSYTSPYEERMKAAADKLINWEYDPNKDVSYGVYKNQYVNNGQRAYEDALAKYASRTDGVPSSYAVTAAQQQYDNYMSELSSKIPTLEQAAYERVKNEYSLNKELNEYDTAQAKERFNQQEAARKAAYNNALSAYEGQKETTQGKSEWYDTALKKAKEYTNPYAAVQYLEGLVETKRLSEKEAEDIIVAEMGLKMSDFYKEDGTWKNGPEKNQTENTLEENLDYLKANGASASTLLGMIAEARRDGTITAGEAGILFRKYS